MPAQDSYPDIRIRKTLWVALGAFGLFITTIIVVIIRRMMMPLTPDGFENLAFTFFFFVSAQLLAVFVSSIIIGKTFNDWPESADKTQRKITLILSASVIVIWIGLIIRAVV